MHFPLKLYQIVQAGPADVISWSDNGKSFIILDADMFCNKILPKHFRHNKLTSFQRQLNLYGFQRIAKGTEAGRYQHALFDKHRPDKLATIKRESRSAMNNNGDTGDDQVSEDDLDTANTNKQPVPNQCNSGRSGTRSARAKKVVAGPEDHTAALAMINISRSLSSECLEGEDTRSASSSPGLSDSVEPVCPIVKHSEFEHVLQQSLDRQSALEHEVTELKLMVKSMMSKMENIPQPSSKDRVQNQCLHGEPFSIEPLPCSSSSASSTSSDDEEGVEEKRPLSMESDDDSQFPPAKRCKAQPLPLTTSLSTFSMSVADLVSPNMTGSPQLVSPREGLEQ